MKYELAFIVPIYNTEVSILRRCIESTQSITDIEFEIVLVDDGSEDDKAEKYRELAAEYQNCYLFRKNNGGASSARNYGIEKAEADYLYFIDADDKIEPKAFSPNLLKEKYDILFSNISVVDGESIDIWKALSNAGKVNIGIILERLSRDGKFNGPVGKIIRCDFLLKNNIRFPEDMIHAEDGMFFAEMLSHNPKMYYLDVNSYYYYREGGTYRNRIINHPDIVIRDVKRFHEKINEMVLFNVGKTEKNDILCKELKKYIKELFNIASELAIARQLKGNNINLISDAVNGVDKNIIKNISVIDRFRFLLLRSKKCFLIYLYGCLRKVYLMIKGS